MPPSVVRASRVITVSFVAVRLLLLARTVQAAAMQVEAPVNDVFFPAILKDPFVLLMAMVVPLATAAVALLRPARGSLRVHALVETTSAAVLLVHQATFFLATWVVDFWAGTLLIWMAWSGVKGEQGAREKGPFLAQLIIAFLFLGGAAGKWTAGYWSGEVFFDLFFRDNPSWLFALMRDLFAEPSLRGIATAYSRTVILAESTLALVVFMPARPAAVLSVLAALGMWSASVDLFEVTIPIIGLACALWILSTTRASTGFPRVPEAALLGCGLGDRGRSLLRRTDADRGG